MNQHNTPRERMVQDDEYADAIQTVVDENMRIDTLAPNVRNVIENDVKLQELLIDIVIKAIEEKSAAKDAINTIIDQNKSAKTQRMVKTIATVLVTAVVSGVVGWLLALLGIGR